MTVFLNGNELSVDYSITLKAFLENHSLAQKQGIAVAINNQVIRRDAWETTAINDQDKVLVISATKGG